VLVSGAGVPPELLDALQAIDYRTLPGAEHSPNDLAFSIGGDH
jgi:hypothetical protein